MNTGDGFGDLKDLLTVIGLALCVGLTACGKKPAASKLPPDLARSVAEKRVVTKELANLKGVPVPKGVWEFYDLMEQNDWPHATNVFERLREQSGTAASPQLGFWKALSQLFANPNGSPTPTALTDAPWCAIHETFGLGETFREWDPQLLHRFGQDIIDSIPTNSIYFGGTDAGRFIVTALSASHREARPFFTLTQNQLADGRYLGYLRFLYGDRIYIPTEADSQTAFSTYLKDAQQRLQSGQLRPGEDVKVNNGRVTVSGQVAVMQINGLLVKAIFDNNPEREFYLEESFPLDWMYPYLTPHGPILKLNRKPLAILDAPSISADRAYWQRHVGQFVGNWLQEDTSVTNVCAFAERVYLRKDLKAFTGDRAFLQNEAAQKAFSKLRSSIAHVYVWHSTHDDLDDAKARMEKAADYAFRQALALCPYSPEAVYGYADLLVKQKRAAEAVLVAQTCLRLNPSDAQVSQLLQNLKQPAAPRANGP